MGRKRHTAEQIISKLRIAEVDLLDAPSRYSLGNELVVPLE